MLPTPARGFGVRGPGADLELDHLVLLGEHITTGEDLGGLFVIVPEELAPMATIDGERLQAQAPEAHVGLVDPLVADVAVAVVPMPVPVVVDDPLGVRTLLSGSLPEIPVERRGSGVPDPWRGRSTRSR